MSVQEQDINSCKTRDWRPNASLAAIRARAELLRDIRTFFAERKILEVETPLLCNTAATDPHLLAIEASLSFSEKAVAHKYYLQTSPEFAMKRLLAAELGSIFQICKAFRDGEIGRYHNPEFTILEWYHIGFDHLQLMKEVDEFLKFTLGTKTAERVSYQALFMQYLNIDPHQATLNELKNKAISLGCVIDNNHQETLNSDDWLNILMTHSIEPHLGFDAPLMVYDYPASQAALSRIRKGPVDVAERFEVYIQGIELANGYHELTDPEFQLERFKKDLSIRVDIQRPIVPIDMCLIEALEAGLPDCAGIAFGVDRLLMLKLKQSHIESVLSFTSERA